MILAAVGACSEGTPTEHAAVWNGLDERTVQAATGMYIAKMEAGGLGQTVKMLLLK